MAVSWLSNVANQGTKHFMNNESNTLSMLRKNNNTVLFQNISLKSKRNDVRLALSLYIAV